MTLYLELIFFIVSLLYLSFYPQNKVFQKERNDLKVRESTLLAIGILSAQDNIAQRDALRSTWLKNINTKIVKPWFIIGNNTCPIPISYRLNKYSCEKWNINISEIQPNFFTSSEIDFTPCLENSRNEFKQGFSFQVNHPIILTRLGILQKLIKSNSLVKVALLDIQTKEIIAQVSLSNNESYIVNGFIYANVEKMLLPKGYQGLILVEGYLEKSACSKITWNNGGGIINFERIYNTPYHLDSIKYSKNIFTAISAEFSIQDIDLLKNIINEEKTITSKWLTHVKALKQNLLLESQERQDIIFVDLIDIYRNLPLKLLHFYKWLIGNYNFSYMLKTDDDCIINIPNILEKLKNPEFNSSKIWFWSRFRKEWPLNYVGKWADFDYQSPIYPTFPCGAGYIMPYKIVSWLSSNSEILYAYQGEDVSMGIWLTAIKPKFIDDENWECGFHCNKESYNRAQLNSSQLYETWSLYEKCENLCSCDL